VFIYIRGCHTKLEFLALINVVVVEVVVAAAAAIFPPPPRLSLKSVHLCKLHIFYIAVSYFVQSFCSAFSFAFAVCKLHQTCRTAFGFLFSELYKIYM